ncbi:MAG TPA: ABC transporter ATP-binding protein [Candidatus Solibacter sp.]|nr:ABC transporter ATP-binding protein [Candidatus Solibacter sp.]
MSDVVVRMEQVYKKFRKGEVYNSLRDLLPALTGRMFRQQELNQQDNREFWALQDLSFEVKAGECLGIIGRNGAGKSTTLKILSRIMKPTKGRMVVQGRLSALIEVAAGFHQDLTGRENIFLNGTILGMSKPEIESKLDQIISFSGIEEFIDTPVKRYSSGMFARLGFSVAAHVDPDVLIVDEVLSVGDFAFQQKCVERMKDVLRGGVAVLFVSHNLKTVAEFCDRCLLLDRGRPVALGSPEVVIHTYLNDQMGGTHTESNDASVRISSVRVRDQKGEAIRFRSGQKVWVDVELMARIPCKKLAVTLYILDDTFREVFEASTDLLGEAHFDLQPGERFRCTFELDLNLASGTFYPSVLIYRRDMQAVYDKSEPAATIYVGDDGGVRGIVNCFPRVIHQRIQRVEDSGHAEIVGEAGSRGQLGSD